MDQEEEESSQLTPREQRVLLAEQRARLASARTTALDNHTLVYGLMPPMLQQQPLGPAGRRFDLARVVRVPVVRSDAAREALLHTHHDGRIFHQALSEAAGLYGRGQIGRIELDIEENPYHGDLLVIRVIHQSEVDGEIEGVPPPPAHHVLRLPMRDMALHHGYNGLEGGHVPPTPVRTCGEPAFHAAVAATDIIKNYPHYR
jgi:hypothetical protein